MLFFVNHTSPPESVPYHHTLSLHDDRPICQDSRAGVRVLRVGGTRKRSDRRVLVVPMQRCSRAGSEEWVRDETGRREGDFGRTQGLWSWRSEEHTSELQSLMRLS